jgi:hypothetical protein
LDAVEVEVEDQVALEEPRGVVGEAAPAEGRMHGEPLQLRDPAPPVDAFETERAGLAPAVVLEHLDDEAPEGIRLTLLPLELGEDALLVERAAAAEKRLHVVVGHDLEQERHVVARRAAQAKTSVLDHGSATAGARRDNPTAPDPSATPPRIRTSPAAVAVVMCSSSSSQP